MSALRLGAVVVAIFVGVVAIAQAQLPAQVNVDVQDNVYAPGDAQVALGGTVKFEYAAGQEVHNVNFEKTGVNCTQTEGVRKGAVGRVLPSPSEGPGWSTECTFSGPGVYRFLCDDHNDMAGKITVANADGTLTVETTPTPTPTPTPQGGTNTPPTGGAPQDSTPLPGGATAPKLTLAASQRGQAVAGSIKGGSASVAVVVETLAALKAKAKPVRVGRASYTVAAGATKRFSIPLNAKGKAALRRLAKLKVTLRFTVAGKTETRTVTLRPPAKSKKAMRSLAQSRAMVKVGDNSFAAKSVTIARGGTVTWRWVGKKGHDVAGPGFASKVIKSGTYSRKFTKKGTISYACTLHRGMTGTVRVK